MKDMSEIQAKDGLTRKQAMAMCKEKFAHATMYAAILFKMMDRKEEQLKWIYNMPSLYRQSDGDVIHFDEDVLRSDTDLVYYLFAENGLEKFTFEHCKKIFKNQPEENLVYMKDCGHYLMDEKPEETTQHVLRFLEDIDKKRINMHYV